MGRVCAYAAAMRASRAPRPPARAVPVLTPHADRVPAATVELIGCLESLDREFVIDFVMRCRQPCGGFAGNVDHDAHILYTLSAVQILALFDALELLDETSVMAYIAGLQRADGSFSGDEWGEVDTRFSYCALCTASLLGRLDAINVRRGPAPPPRASAEPPPRAGGVGGRAYRRLRQLRRRLRL